MIAGVVLAAGTSSRLGRAKQLLPYRGRPITRHVVDTAIAAGLDEVIVVLGHAAEEVRAALDLRPPARAVVNTDYASGQASSLREGLRAVSAGVRAAVILLGDQPGIAAGSIRKALEAYDETGGPIVRAMYGGRPGHPVLLDRSVWDEVERLEGDLGARAVMRAHGVRVVPVEIEGEPPVDVDTWDDYRGLTEGE